MWHGGELLKIKIDMHDIDRNKTNKLKTVYNVRDAYCSGKKVVLEMNDGTEEIYLGTIIRCIDSNDKDYL